MQIASAVRAMNVYRRYRLEGVSSIPVHFATIGYPSTGAAFRAIKIKAAEFSTPSAKDVLERLLRSYRPRFRPYEMPLDGSSDTCQLDRWLAVVEPLHFAALSAWLARGGRFINRDPSTNTLAVCDDAQALPLFLRDRGSRSRHTLRACAADLRRLINWCRDHGLGPLSDLTRNVGRQWL